MLGLEEGPRGQKPSRDGTHSSASSPNTPRCALWKRLRNPRSGPRPPWAPTPEDAPVAGWADKTGTKEQSLTKDRSGPPVQSTPQLPPTVPTSRLRRASSNHGDAHTLTKAPEVAERSPESDSEDPSGRDLLSRPQGKALKATSGRAERAPPRAPVRPARLTLAPRMLGGGVSYVITRAPGCWCGLRHRAANLSCRGLFDETIESVCGAGAWLLVLSCVSCSPSPSPLLPSVSSSTPLSPFLFESNGLDRLPCFRACKKGRAR